MQGEAYTFSFADGPYRRLNSDAWLRFYTGVLVMQYFFFVSREAKNLRSIRILETKILAIVWYRFTSLGTAG